MASTTAIPTILTTVRERERYRTIGAQWIFETFLCPGDVMCLTTAVRDLHKTYPGRFQTGVRTRHPAIWKHNPYITPLMLGQGKRLVVHYDRIFRPGDVRHYDKGIRKRANIHKVHMISGYREYISVHMGLPIPETSPFPDLHFSAEELERRPFSNPYWVIFAGGKNDYTNKLLDTTKYQAVVDALSDVRFVQVGRVRDYHPPLKNVTNLVDKTNLRELILLIKHARGVVCPITCGLHIAAACGTPCVVIAGGREPPVWERYPGQTYIHTIGQMDCCLDGGCFKNRADRTDGNDCPRVVPGPTIDQAACMHAIQPGHIIEAVRSFERGEEGREIIVKITNPPRRQVIHRHLPREVVAPPSNHVLSPELKKVLNCPVTICTLLYGDFHTLHRRCIKSIVRMTDAGSYKLRIGCNEVCRTTLDWIKHEIAPRIPDLRLYVHEHNDKKYPVMREMFADLDRLWVVWLDDDSHFVSPSWMISLAKNVQKHPDVACWGKLYYFHLRGNQDEWIRQASWYTGRPYPLDKTKNPPQPKSDFCTGGFLAIKTEAIKKMDWPDIRIVHNGGDVMLGVALHQQGYRIGKCWEGVKISDHQRRGFREVIAGVR